MMCARIGMVTGTGLASVLRENFPRAWLSQPLALLLANTHEHRSRSSGMADCGDRLARAQSHVWVILFGLGIALATVCWRYDRSPPS